MSFLSTIQNGTSTLTLPTATDTMVARNSTDTLQNKSITNANCSFVDGTDPTKKVSFATNSATTGTTLTIAHQQTTTQTLNIPNITATDTLVTCNVAQTLSNKTLIGSAGGSTTQVQYNNAGDFAGTSQLTIGSDGYPNLTQLQGSAPTAPSAGAKLFSQLRSGRTMASQIGPTNAAYSLQPNLFTNKVGWWSALGNGSTVSTMDFGNSTTGTVTTRNVASTNLFQSMRRVGFVTTATAGNSAGTTHAAQQFWMGNASGLGGFFYVARFGMSSAATVATQRVFVGLCATTTVIGNVNPSTLLNILGFGLDATDSAWTFMHNSSTGGATKDTLTGTFPVRDLSVTMLEARIFCAPNTTTVYYSLQVLGGGSLYEGSTSSDIPSSTTFLSPQIWTNNGTTALAAGIDVVSQYIETDF